MNNSPIGVFDSGVGGLSVFSRLVKLLPEENYIYYADTFNLPYGNKTKEELVKISSSIFDFFQEKGVKAVVMACNTTSATVYEVLKSKYNFEIYPIVQIAAKYIAGQEYRKAGIFATAATVNSHAYKNEIQKYNKNILVYEEACPQWVSIVEKSLFNDNESKENIKMQLDKMLKNDVDKIILGCTHYPYLLNILSKYADEGIFMDPAEFFADYIKNDLSKKKLLNDSKIYKREFYVSSNHKQFEKASSLFYKVEQAKEIKYNQKSMQDTII